MKNPTFPLFKKLFVFIAMFLFPIFSFAQKQPDIPMPRGPVDLSETSNLIIFIVIPAIIIIVFLIFRKRIKRINEEKKEREKNEEREKES